MCTIWRVLLNISSEKMDSLVVVKPAEMSLMSVTPLLCCLAWGKECIYRKDREFGERSIFTAWFFPESPSSIHWQYFKAFLSSVLFECWRGCSANHTFQPLSPLLSSLAEFRPKLFLSTWISSFGSPPGHHLFSPPGCVLTQDIDCIDCCVLMAGWLLGRDVTLPTAGLCRGTDRQTDTSCKVLWQAELSEECFYCYSRSQVSAAPCL